MSGGGSKPRGGKMGTSIKATSVSQEAVANAENELSVMVAKLNTLRQKNSDAVRRYQALEKAVSHLEMELAKSQKEVNKHNTLSVSNYGFQFPLWGRLKGFFGLRFKKEIGILDSRNAPLLAFEIPC